MFHDDCEIERVARDLIERTLPYAEWTHAAHFAAALWLLRHPRVLTRHGGIEPVIRRYNEAVGVPNSATRGYHATITLAQSTAMLNGERAKGNFNTDEKIIEQAGR